MEKYIRKLARSPHYQLLYVRAKEIGSIKLFKNDADYLPVQVLFLHWLEVYHSLFNDLLTHEDFISKEVIENDIKCDAYIIYRNDKRKREWQDRKKSDINLPGKQTMRPC